MEASMSKLYFGVGCLIFRPPLEFEGGPREYANLVKAALQSSKSITNVSISGFEHGTSVSNRFAAYYEDDLYAHRIGAEVMPMGSELSFDVFIPKDVQTRIDTRYADAPGEFFRVHSIYPYGLPCTIVSLRDHPSKPAGAIELASLVLRFLEQEFARSDDKMSVDRIGPSPIHIDFIAEETEGSEISGALTHSAHGYDDCLIKVPKAVAERNGGLVRTMAIHLSEQIAHYYSLVQWLGVRSNIVERLDTAVDAIIGGLAEKGFWRRILETDARSNAIFKAEKMCYDLAFLDESTKAQHESELARLKLVASNIEIEPLYARRFKSAMLSPSSFRAILDAARHANTIELQVRTALIAALMGALFGALVSGAMATARSMGVAGNVVSSEMLSP